MIAGLLDLIPNIGATIAGIIIGIVALTVSVGALIAFVIVIIVYQQIENYILQPTIIGKAAQVSGFTVLASVLVFGALFGFIGAIIGVPIAAGSRSSWRRSPLPDELASRPPTSRSRRGRTDGRRRGLASCPRAHVVFPPSPRAALQREDLLGERKPLLVLLVVGLRELRVAPHLLGQCEDLLAEVEQLLVLAVLLLNGPPLLIGEDLPLGVGKGSG